jgi:predicted ribosome quality control (RQC) complex YloA/Tae2 family protein
LDKRLASLKQQKVALLEKRLDKLEVLLNRLESEDVLLEQAAHYQEVGNLILANMHLIKPYMSTVEVMDFKGEMVRISIPPNLVSASQISNHFFKLAKKAKQKRAHLHIERENLEGKVHHLQHFIRIVQEATSLSAIHMLFPAQERGKKEAYDDAIATFWIEGYKVMLGKNERGNIALLARAKARDIWLHMKEHPSTHVIIVTDKQNVPESVIMAAAKLCVEFTLFDKGRFWVDYTPRREVKVQEGANVLYNKYQSVQVDTSV